MREKITLTLVGVLIDSERGATTISTAVPQHEIEVLKVVHRGRVRETGETDDEIELNVNADAEFARLQRKYRRINEQDPVRFAFHAGPASLKAHGFELGRGSNEPAPMSMQRKHPKPSDGKKAKAKAADKAE